MFSEEALSVQTAIASLARTMHTTSDRHPACEHDVVTEVTTGAADFLPAVDHAGVSLIRRHGKRHTFEAVAPTGQVSRFIDEMQELTGDGPCLTAIRDRTTVVVDDYATDDRWPELTRKIVENSPVRSSLSMLLYTDQQAIGALNLYAETADAFDDDAVEHAEALAAHAAVGISAARRDEQFRSALASRDIIGQAKGMIMERFDIDSGQAFRLLSRLSQDQNIPVVTIATQLVDAARTDRQRRSV